jgi:hypothetical protein
MSAIPRGSRQRRSSNRFFSPLSLKVAADGCASAVRLPSRTGLEGWVVVLGERAFETGSERKQKESAFVVLARSHVDLPSFEPLPIGQSIAQHRSGREGIFNQRT